MRAPKKLRCSSTSELSQLWYMRYATTSVATTDTSRPVLTLRTISKLTKLTVNQVSVRLAWYKERATVSMENPEEVNSPMQKANNEVDLSWVTQQETRNHYLQAATNTTGNSLTSDFYPKIK